MSMFIDYEDVIYRIQLMWPILSSFISYFSDQFLSKIIGDIGNAIPPHCIGKRYRTY